MRLRERHIGVLQLPRKGQRPQILKIVRSAVGDDIYLWANACDETYIGWTLRTYLVVPSCPQTEGHILHVTDWRAHRATQLKTTVGVRLRSGLFASRMLSLTRVCIDEMMTLQLSISGRVDFLRRRRFFVIGSPLWGNRFRKGIAA